MTSRIWHPLTQHGLGIPEIHIDRADGAYLYNGDRKIIDAISSWWVITHGHCHPKIVEAVQAQAGKLEQVIFAGFTHEPAEALAEALLDVANPVHEHVFFSDSGSTAVEVALKMAVGYHAHAGRPRHKFIALEGGYHGDTFGAMAAGSRGVFNEMFESMLFQVEHIPVPVAGAEEDALSILEAVLKREGGDIAGFIFEPLVQGSAGMQIYSAKALKAMCDLCQDYGVLLIADEVMTGFGRTGSFFACDQAGVTPDLVALSKGLTAGFLPMGATLATRDIYMAFYHDDRSKTFFHSTSFTGNALACVAAKASLDLWIEEDTQGKINKIANKHRDAAKRFAGYDCVDNVRSLGTIFALDIVQSGSDGYLSDVAPKLMRAALERDVLLRPVGNAVYVLPPYCVTDDDLDGVYGVIEQLIR